MNILIVDDEPEIASLLKEALEMRGYEVVTAGDGVEGMYKAMSIKPDLIVTDILMPRMDGTELSERLQMVAATKDIPILFLTALENKEDEYRHDKADGMPKNILAKPASISHILDRIRELI